MNSSGEIKESVLKMNLSNLSSREKELIPNMQLTLIEKVIEKGRTEQVIKLILDTAVDSRRWESALQEVCKYLDASAVTLAEYDFEYKEGKILHAVGYDHFQLRRYAEKYSSLNSWFLQARDWYTYGKVGRGEEILSSDELVNSQFYAEWLKPMNFFHRLCAVVNKESQRVFYLEAVRSKSEGAFPNQALFFLRAIVPYFQWATKCNYLFWKLIVTKDVLDHLSFMTMVVDKHARPLFMNRVAHELLSEEDGLCISQERLCVSDIKSAAKFKALIMDTAAASAGKSGHMGGVIKVWRRERLPLWIVVSPLSRKLRKVIGQEDEVALVFGHSPESVGIEQQTTMETFYGLTPAEQRVAHLIMEGYKLDDAADRLAISINTLRTHMKRIYAKTNTNRQSELVRVLLTGPWNQRMYNDEKVTRL